MPALSSQDKATDAIHDLINILLNTGPTTPFLEYGPKAKTAVEQLADIFITKKAPEQHNPYPPIEQRTDTSSTSPTEKPIPPVPNEHAYQRVPEQP